MMSFAGVVLYDKGRNRAGSTRPDTVLNDVSLVVTPGRYAVVGSDQERTAFVDLLVRRRIPARGRFCLQQSISFPIGRVSFLSLPIRGIDFTRFICSLYNLRETAVLDILNDRLPWPSILSRRLAEAPVPHRLSLSLMLGSFINTDVLLIDGSMTDPNFPQGFVEELAFRYGELASRKSVIVSSRQLDICQILASKSLVLGDGNLFVRDGVNFVQLARSSESEEEKNDADYEDDLLI